MKIVTTVTAVLVATLSVAAAATPAAAHPYDRYAGGGRSFFASLFGPSIARGVVSYPTNQKPGTIIVSTAQRRLYLVLGNGQALSYAIAVGKAGYADPCSPTLGRIQSNRGRPETALVAFRRGVRVSSIQNLPRVGTVADVARCGSGLTVLVLAPASHFEMTACQ